MHTKIWDHSVKLLHKQHLSAITITFKQCVPILNEKFCYFCSFWTSVAGLFVLFSTFVFTVIVALLITIAYFPLFLFSAV